jgi:hypothetical protein
MEFILGSLLGVVVRSFALLLILALIAFLVKKPFSLALSAWISAGFLLVLWLVPYFLTMNDFSFNLAVAIVCAALAFLIATFRNKAERERAKTLEGTEGFLIIAAFYLAATAIVFAGVYIIPWSYELNDYTAFGLLIFAVAILYTIMNVLAFAALLKKLRVFFLLGAATFALGAVLNVVLTLSFEEISYFTVAPMFIIDVIMLAYVLTSCRVRNTFVRPLKTPAAALAAAPAEEENPIEEA